MKNFPIVSIFCFSMLFAVASAQESSAEQREIEEYLRYLSTPKQQIYWEANQFASMRSSWNGQGSFIPLSLLLRAKADDELELTEEQQQRLAPLRKDNELGREWIQQKFQNPTPEMRQELLQRDMAIQATINPDDPNFERATEEQKNAHRDANIAKLNLFLGVMQAEVQDILTPEQMLQVRKLEMQLMPELGIPFPSMFDPLDLTEEQKKEMDRIAEEMKVEFDRLTMEAAVLHAERTSSLHRSLQGKIFASHEELQTALHETHRQFVPNEAMRKKGNDLQEQGTKLMSLLQTRLMNVLTNEQLVKMQEILDATPEFAKKVIADFKARREEAKKSPTYIPGPDAWRPGSPVPLQFQEERRRSRFPRGEN